MKQTIRPTLIFLLAFTLLLGIIYPALITGFARVMFPGKAKGSIVYIDETPQGSALIGQSFSRPDYFWGRPSATTSLPCNATLSTGSNQGPTNPALIKAVTDRIDALKAVDPGNELPLPIDLVTSSGSGLDPHISPEAAFYQVPRVARTRGISEDSVNRLVVEHIENRLVGLFGEPRVNVLLLNLALNRLERNDRE